MIRPHLYVWLACFFKSYTKTVDLGVPALPEDLQPDEAALRLLKREVLRLEHLALSEADTAFVPDDLADLGIALAYADAVWDIDYFFSSVLDAWQESMVDNIPFIDPDAAKCTSTEFRAILLRLLLALRFLEFVEMREQLAVRFDAVPELPDCVCEAMLFLIELSELNADFIVSAIAACDDFGRWVSESSEFESDEFYEAIYPPEEYLCDDDEEEGEDDEEGSFDVHRGSAWAERGYSEASDDDEDTDTRRAITGAILCEMKALLAAL